MDLISDSHSGHRNSDIILSLLCGQYRIFQNFHKKLHVLWFYVLYFSSSWLIACKQQAVQWHGSESRKFPICFENSVQSSALSLGPTVQFGMDWASLQAGSEQFVDQNDESCQVRAVKLSSHDCLSLRDTNISNINVSIQYQASHLSYMLKPNTHDK